ncbi:hypothetical protein HYH02_006450 [Chlamydomonas schloesseri]|uniref:SAM domain-containing protein n=1 Tax=Chlamydomonas schloesseri TaxID=2026947 RepID=A0A835WJ01_9CHLO|nr:hypothetical protein HYH02_006450 [Chlamydomonas schloesseri]|eukprot:KAG2448559.1 hypothetical protein HYH02_006450 [Chlamydomonas schloesseri]
MAGNSLRAWLQYLRIDKYHDQLARAGHDARSLAQLDDGALAALGLPLGPRKKIRLNAGIILQSCEAPVLTAACPGPVVAAERSQLQPAPDAGLTPRADGWRSVQEQHPQQHNQPNPGPVVASSGRAAASVGSGGYAAAGAALPGAVPCELWMGTLTAPMPAVGPAPGAGGPSQQPCPSHLQAQVLPYPPKQQNQPHLHKLRQLAPAPAAATSSFDSGRSSHGMAASSPVPPPSVLVLAEQRALTELYSYPCRNSPTERRQHSRHAGPQSRSAHGPSVRGALPPREVPRPARPPMPKPHDGRPAPVLKRSRTWDGSCLMRSGMPAPPATCSRVAAGPEQGAGAMPPGQDLYAAAASAGPVEVDFGPLKMEAAEAAVAARQRRQQLQEQRQQQEQQERMLHLVLEGVASRAASGNVAAPARAASTAVETSQATIPHARSCPQGAARASAPAGVVLPLAPSSDAAGSAAAAPAPAPATTTTAVEAAAPAAAGASLLDDPRNYETPELLALLLQEDRAAAESDDAVAAAAIAEAEAAGAQVAAGADAAPGAQPTREQRQARLRALREEVAATERLLETLRAMVAEEERALAAESSGPGGLRGGVPAAAGRAGGSGAGAGTGVGGAGAGTGLGRDLLRLDADWGQERLVRTPMPAVDADSEAQLWHEWDAAGDAPTQVWGMGEDMMLTERLGMLGEA